VPPPPRRQRGRTAMHCSTSLPPLIVMHCTVTVQYITISGGSEVASVLHHTAPLATNALARLPLLRDTPRTLLILCHYIQREGTGREGRGAARPPNILAYNRP